ncbi:hypothetical protein RNO80_17165, partial [Escherichia coli]|nr:hypothetical protein [Escherichia coli]
MASTEEKLLTLLLSVEHLQHTAMEQQKAVADSLAVARETLRGYRDISDGVAKQVRDEVPGTYVRPHRHPHTFELLLPLRGRFVV